MEITVRSDQRTKIDRNTLLKAMEPRVIGRDGVVFAYTGKRGSNTTKPGGGGF